MKPSNLAHQDWIRMNRNRARILRFPNLVLSECRGLHVKDILGKTYMDFTSGAHTCNVGHNHPEIASTIIKQMEKTGSAPMNWVVNPTCIKLAQKIKQIAPSSLKSGKVGFCNTGSDATEISMRLAQIYTKKPWILSFYGCSHGQTSMAASSLNTSPRRRHGFPIVAGIAYVPFPYCYRCLWGKIPEECDLQCFELLKYKLDTNVIPSAKIAAFFIEPIQLHGGITVPPKRYIQELKELCEKYGILLVSDEVATGFGRTGKMFGIENYNISPDIMYMAKSIAAGLPLGAVIANEDIMTEFIGGGTFSGSSISCAAALANIHIIQKEKLLENAAKSGSYIKEKLHEMSNQHKIIGDVRGKGLLLGVELVKDRIRKTPAREETRSFVRKAEQRGLLLFPAGVYENVLRVYPPLSIKKSEIDSAVKIMSEILSEIGD